MLLTLTCVRWLSVGPRDVLDCAATGSCKRECLQRTSAAFTATRSRSETSKVRRSNAGLLHAESRRPRFDMRLSHDAN